MYLKIRKKLTFWDLKCVQIIVVAEVVVIEIEVLSITKEILVIEHKQYSSVSSSTNGFNFT